MSRQGGVGKTSQQHVRRYPAAISGTERDAGERRRHQLREISVVHADHRHVGGLTAIDTRRDVYGQDRRVVLIHSQTLHDDQARSFTGTTLAKVGRA